MTNEQTFLDSIDAEISAERDSLIDFCGRLVREPSESPPGETLGVSKVVQAYLGEHGVASEVVACDPNAPNLVAHLGEGAGRHVVYNAHMDTMRPGDESRWSVPILELTRKDGRLYGLGMGNMKGGLAAMCLAIAVLARHRKELPGRLTMTAVCDEVMFGDRGAVHLLAARPDVHGDYMISGEGPGFMNMAPAEKGLLWLDVETTGDGGHSSRAMNGETAVGKLVALLTRADALNDVYAEIPAEIDGVTGGPENTGLRLSFSAGVVRSDGVRSLIATAARAEIDVRLPPGITGKEIEQRVREFGPAEGISVRAVKGWDASWTSLSNPVVAEMMAAATTVRGKRPDMVVRLPGSDARRWRDLGVPSVCYGPQPTLSAGVDDYAEEQAVLDCARVYARAALRLMKHG